MKVNLKHMLKTYRGSCDGMVYYYHPRLKRLIGRVHVIPRRTEQNARMGEIAKNLKLLDPSPGFIEDLRTYIYLLDGQSGPDARIAPGWYNHYWKLMWAMSRGQGTDLRTLTREAILGQDLPCRSVRRAVEAGLLVPVRGYELLTAEF